MTYLFCRRIICVFKPTPNYLCQMERYAVKRKRSHKWMIIRMLVLYIPFLLTVPVIVEARVLSLFTWKLLFTSLQTISWYINIGWNGIYAIANLVVTAKLYSLREKFRSCSKYLDESDALLSYHDGIEQFIDGHLNAKDMPLWRWLNTYGTMDCTCFTT